MQAVYCNSSSIHLVPPNQIFQIIETTVKVIKAIANCN